jgi:hypothetical protein
MEMLLRGMGEARARYERCPGRAPGTDIRISAKEKHLAGMIPGPCRSPVASDRGFSAGLVLVVAARLISPGLEPHGPRLAMEYGAPSFSSARG